jgi:hypothetical protein
MKTTYTTTLLVVITTLFTLPAFCQIQNSALVAKFGIDGDLKSDYRQNGAFTATGSHDWFKTADGFGKGVIDTTGAAALKSLLAAGKNIAFTKGTSIPRFSIIDSFVHLDAVYGRDYNDKDKTSFVQGSKNGDNPSKWVTNPSGSMVQDKSDIIDAYASMRRDGITVNNTTPSHMILSMGTTILGTTGNRYVDFELFVNRISFDDVTGKFSGNGVASKGGHQDFQFNADGSLKQVGDVDVSFTYSSTTVTAITIYIWVNKSTYQNTTGQAAFNFVPGEFYGDGNNATWGYAKIVAKSGATLPLWGSVNSSTIAAPIWGTASKELGASNENYYATANSVGQFSETAIDLTSIGIDPAFNNTAGNSCNPPYTRIMIKTRSSASFTSALSDFAGPFAFLDAPVVSAKIIDPQSLTCGRTSVVVSPVSEDNGLYYNWSTNNGNIVGETNTRLITIDQPGKYYLIASASPGCPTSLDSVVIGLDTHKPVASAFSIGILNETFTNTVQLLGGDTLASQIETPFGNSHGLLWNWSNEKGFLSNAQNPLTSDSGWHQLIITEERNGCMDTATVNVLWNVSILGAKFGATTVNVSSNKQASVQWMIQSETGSEQYDLERSTDGVHFSKVFHAAANRISINNTYRYADNLAGTFGWVVYYRVKMILPSGQNLYSTVAKASLNNTNKNIVSDVFQNASGRLQVNYFTGKSQPVTLRMVDINGRMIASSTQESVEGNNKFVFSSTISKYKNQVVVVQVIAENEMYTKKTILF